MTSRAKDRNLRVSVARRLMIDLMWASAGMARVNVTRLVKLSDVMSARRVLADPPSLTAIFVKAFALVAVEMPELRRVYMKWPWPHLHEYADNTVSIPHEAQIMGDIGLLPLRLRQPDLLSLRLLTPKVRSDGSHDGSMSTLSMRCSAGPMSIRKRCVSGARRSSIPSARSRLGWEQPTS